MQITSVQALKPQDLALLTPAQCATMDHAAEQVVPVTYLMERAGWFVAREIQKRYRPCKILFLCGPGNNGGDGYVAARYLANVGWPVAVASLSAPRAQAAARAESAYHGVRATFSQESIRRSDLVVDAVFGAGLDRPPDVCVQQMLLGAKRLCAIDLPSGVNGLNGALLYPIPQHELTITFAARKIAHLIYPARARMGEIVCGDIGMPAKAWDAIDVGAWQNAPGLWVPPRQSIADHKYARGVVSICCGRRMTGASYLTAGGARASGAGLVRLFLGDSSPNPGFASPGVIVDHGSLSDALSDERRKVWVCGPGMMPEEVAATLPVLLAQSRHVVADAGALTWASDCRNRLRGVSVITPHIGEFSALFGAPGAERVAAVRQAARSLDCVVVLKGADTLIAAPDGRVAINIHSSPSLATAGSGDTLSGVVATFLASGMPAWEAAAAAVWIHGEAGLRAGTWPIAEDFERFLGGARVKATELACARV